MKEELPAINKEHLLAVPQTPRGEVIYVDRRDSCQNL